MSQMTMTRQEITATEGVTLDGERAKITGYRNDFASVTNMDASKRVEFAWATAEFIVLNRAAAFHS